MALPVKHVKATQAHILTAAVDEGTLAFTSDGQNLYWDVDGKRVQITDIIELASESDRIALLTPIEKFYFVLTTGVFWRYHNGSWSIIGGISGESSVLSPTQPSGQKENDSWLQVLS
jgi:hypothetical protein